MKMAVFWVVAPRSLVEVYQRFRGPCCLHHQGEDSHLQAAESYDRPTKFAKKNMLYLCAVSCVLCFKDLVRTKCVSLCVVVSVVLGVFATIDLCLQ
jgi:hypothetical protein